MKKLTAALMALMMVFALVCAAAENAEPFTFRNGIAFGMSMEEVLAAETEQVHEIDTEHTHGPVTFAEAEYEHIRENDVPADIKYLFVEDKLVAIRMEFETRDIAYETVKADLAAQGGEFTALDLALLGNGIFAVDDDGTPEQNTVMLQQGDVMIVLELDADGEDIDVTIVDLTAEYIK